MMIYNVTQEILQQALNAANRKFGGNLKFKRVEMKGRTREGGEKWNVTLTVFSTWRKVPGGPGERPLVKVTAPGVRIGHHFGDGTRSKRIAAACWHAHGTFFDALPKYIHASSQWACSPDFESCASPSDKLLRVRIITGRLTTHPGDPWNDFNIGSSMYPLMLSEACECDDVEPENGRRDVGERNRKVFATAT